MNTNKNQSDDGQEDFTLDPSLQAFEQSLRKLQPRDAHVSSTDESDWQQSWTSPTLTISRSALAVSCGASAMAGAAAVLLVVSLGWPATALPKSDAERQVVRESTSEDQRVLPFAADSRLVASSDSNNTIKVGELIANPKLVEQLTWSTEGIAASRYSSNSLETSIEPQTIDTPSASQNTLFQLSRELQL